MWSNLKKFLKTYIPRLYHRVLVFPLRHLTTHFVCLLKKVGRPNDIPRNAANCKRFSCDFIKRKETISLHSWLTETQRKCIVFHDQALMASSLPALVKQSGNLLCVSRPCDAWSEVWHGTAMHHYSVVGALVVDSILGCALSYIETHGRFRYDFNHQHCRRRNVACIELPPRSASITPMLQLRCCGGLMIRLLNKQTSDLVVNYSSIRSSMPKTLNFSQVSSNHPISELLTSHVRSRQTQPTLPSPVASTLPSRGRHARLI